MDFTPAPGPSQKKKGMSSTGKIKVLVALLIIEGVIIGVMAAFWPRTPTWRTDYGVVPVREGGAACPEEPDYHEFSAINIGKTPWANRTLYAYAQYNLSEILNRVSQYRGDLTSIALSIKADCAYNFTWCNITRVIAVFNLSTVTWNTRPETAETLGYAPIKLRSVGNDEGNSTIDVTDLALGLLQAGGGNLSFSVAPMGWPDYSWVYLELQFTYTVPETNRAAVNPAYLFIGVVWLALVWTKKEKPGGGKC
ncbi:MAG: hypothetical protein RBG13Loki_0849 [Promethearchaeota archaeon CR_4]|nr:MAG: hypothetical protein RBG13Loki_0849 [Candidatus Lokiarchaeota archaeon CR_4]